MELESNLTPKGWLDKGIVPILLQGFTQQVVNSGAATFVDKRQFEITTDRGVVTKLDYVCGTLQQFVQGVTEDIWNDATISLKGGGQDLLVGVAAERYDYSLDLGDDKEMPIHLRLAGGQVLESVLELDAASGSTAAYIQAQLQVSYSNQELEDWRKTLTWKAGTGLKRRDFKLTVPLGLDMQFTLEDIIPKNQGSIIGVSFLAMSAECFNWDLDFEVNGIKIVDNVNCLRFSRLSQREPYIFYFPFQAGTKFKAILNLQALISSNNGAFFVTFYFDN